MAQRGQHFGFQVLYLELDVEKGALAVALDHIVEPRQLRQPPGLGPRYRDPTHLGIVADHGRSAGRQTNIELKTVAAMLEGKIERGKSILRDSGGHTSAAMAEEEGKGHCAF